MARILSCQFSLAVVVIVLALATDKGEPRDSLMMTGSVEGSRADWGGPLDFSELSSEEGSWDWFWVQVDMCLGQWASWQG